MDEPDVRGVDTSPIIRVSAMNDRAAARRDSWDAIAKTKNILSHRSLESVANLTDNQLDSHAHQKTEHSNYATREQHFKSNYSQNYSTQQKYSSNDDNNMERSYSTQVYRSGGNRSGGANSVKVQPIPDGVLGQPVEFESM